MGESLWPLYLQGRTEERNWGGTEMSIMGKWSILWSLDGSDYTITTLCCSNSCSLLLMSRLQPPLTLVSCSAGWLGCCDGSYSSVSWRSGRHMYYLKVPHLHLPHQFLVVKKWKYGEVNDFWLLDRKWDNNKEAWRKEERNDSIPLCYENWVRCMYPYVSPGNSVLESTWRGNLPLDFLHGHIETFRFLFF